MLKDNSQLKLSLSPYQGIYEVIIPNNHLLRRIKENIDFSFVNPMLRKQYCEHFGRPAKEPEMMFKLLFLKKLYDLSDEILFWKGSVFHRISGHQKKRQSLTRMRTMWTMMRTMAMLRKMRTI